jgi:hypothetical protein
MRRLSLGLLLMFLLPACSGIPFLGATPLPTNTLGPTATATVTSTPTITATASVTPTLTSSPTIVHFATQDPNLPTETFVPIPIFIGIDTITPVISSTPVKPGPGFDSVDISDPKIFWGACIPGKTLITAQVVDPDTVISVVIFMQVKSMKKEDYTPWTNGNVMYKYKGGLYTYVLKANETDGHDHYKDSYIRFQLVATDNYGQEVGRTKIYTQSIVMSPCMCYEPLKGCPLETPKPTATKKGK